MKDSGFERRQIVDDRIPYRFNVNLLVCVPQMVSRASYLVPRYVGAKCRRPVPEADGGFTDYRKLALHSGHRHRIGAESLEIHARGEILDHGDGVRNVTEQEARISKRQGRLLARPGASRTRPASRGRTDPPGPSAWWQVPLPDRLYRIT